MIRDMYGTYGMYSSHSFPSWTSPEWDGANGRYPTCLAYLTLLQSEMFRDRLRDPGFAKELYRIGQRHHETWYVFAFTQVLRSDGRLMIRRVEEYLKDSSKAVGNTDPVDRVGDREEMNPKQEVGL